MPLNKKKTEQRGFDKYTKEYSLHLKKSSHIYPSLIYKGIDTYA